MRKTALGLIVSSIGLGWSALALANHAGECRSGQDVIHLTDQPDGYTGTNADQCVDGKDRNDFIAVRGGNDDAFGGDGTDSLHGEAGNDRLYGEAGSDVLNGGAGADRLEGATLDDQIADGRNPSGQGDTIIGGGGEDILQHCHDGDQAADTFSGIEHHNHGDPQTDEFCDIPPNS